LILRKSGKETRRLSAAQAQALSTSHRAQPEVAGEEKNETARSLGLSLSARNTIPRLGQVLNLFRTEASQIVYPVLGQRGQKTIPCPAAHTRITQIRQYPPGPGGQV